MTEQEKIDRRKAFVEVANKAAKSLDQHIGRKEPHDPLGPLSGVTVDSLLPPRLRDDPTIDTITRTVKWSAATVKVIAIAGEGTISAAVGAATSSATVGSFDTFFSAFFATFALSVSATALTYLTLKGHMKSYGALGIWVISSFLIAGVAQNMGFAGPSASDLSDRYYDGGNPIAQAFNVMRVFFDFYGPLPFLSGIVVGAGAGWIIINAEKQST